MNEKEKVDSLLDQMDHPRRAQIEALREIFLSSDSRIVESVKWNAPSYAVREHFATFKLQPKMTVQIIFHTGAKVRKDAPQITIDDPSKLLKWITTERAVITFDESEEIAGKRESLMEIIKQWIKYI